MRHGGQGVAKAWATAWGCCVGAPERALLTWAGWAGVGGRRGLLSAGNAAAWGGLCPGAGGGRRELPALSHHTSARLGCLTTCAPGLFCAVKNDAAAAHTTRAHTQGGWRHRSNYVLPLTPYGWCGQTTRCAGSLSCATPRHPACGHTARSNGTVKLVVNTWWDGQHGFGQTFCRLPRGLWYLRYRKRTEAPGSAFGSVTP